MKIRKDIVANFNQQIEIKIKRIDIDIKRYTQMMGYGHTVRGMIERKNNLQDMKRIFNTFSETGELIC